MNDHYEGLTRKQRKTLERKARKAERAEQKKKDRHARLLRNVILGIVGIGLILMGYQAFLVKSPEEQAFEQAIEVVSLEDTVEEFPIEGANHITDGARAVYNTNPPTSGPHYAQPANWGFYDEPIPDERLVHNIEHGGIWISYTGSDDETAVALKSIAKRNSGSVIVTPREANDDPIVVASWGRMMRLSQVDEVRIQKFIDMYINQSPERLAH